MIEEKKRRIERRKGCQICGPRLIDFHDQRGHVGCVTSAQMREAFRW